MVTLQLGLNTRSLVSEESLHNFTVCLLEPLSMNAARLMALFFLVALKLRLYL
jgi:hypothetical protein